MIDDTIAAPGVAHRAMAAELDLIADLMGGTAAMRRAGQRWLPREPAESWTAWRARLNRSVLFNGLARTVQALAGRPFARPVFWETDHEGLRQLMRDLDGQGGSLNSIAERSLHGLLRDGITHLLIDRPQAGGALYVVPVRANQLLGVVRDEAGLAEIRIREITGQRVGKFGEMAIQQIRRITRSHWQIWRLQSNPFEAGMADIVGADAQAGQGWRVVAEGAHDFGQIPLITMNAASTGFMQARPPLIDLAWLNLAHWQSASDQRHILHVARVPVLFGRGLQAPEGQIEIGPNRLVLADDPAADLRFVEHSGAAIAAGRQDLVDLEDKMAVLGLDMLRHRPGPATATERVIDAAQNQASLNSIVLTLENGLQRCIKWLADAEGVTAAHRGELVISRRQDIGDEVTAEADLLLRARRAGEISTETFLDEITRRGILGHRPEAMPPSAPKPQ